MRRGSVIGSRRLRSRSTSVWANPWVRRRGRRASRTTSDAGEADPGFYAEATLAFRNLTLKRPAWLPEFGDLLLRVELVPTALGPLHVRLADKDAPLFCAAILSRCQLFVTGDKRDFGHVMGQTIEGVEVASPLRLAQLLAAQRR